MKGSIIIAEDEIAGEHYQEFLDRRGYLVMLYKNGKTLTDDIQNGIKYQLAFIDLSLPEVDGIEIIKISKKHNPQVPVVSMSGYSFSSRDSDKHLIKPFVPKALERIAKEFLGKKVGMPCSA